MKKTTIITSVLIALFLNACNSNYNEQEIRSNAQGYLQAVGNYNFDEAIPYASKQTREKTIPIFKHLQEHADTAYVNSNRPAEFTFHNVRRLSDTTARIYYHKHTPIAEIDDSLTLLYEDGHWLADVHLGFIPYVTNKPTHGNVSDIPIDLTMKAYPVDSLKRRKISH